MAANLGIEIRACHIKKAKVVFTQVREFREGMI
jgi:hypothetical protein